jgi:hypothetical protein
MESVLLDFPVDDLNEHHRCIKFSLKFRENVSETYVCSERLSVTLPWGEH